MNTDRRNSRIFYASLLMATVFGLVLFSIVRSHLGGEIEVSEDMEAAVVHIFRFKADKIVEARDLGQQILENSPNEHGLF